MSPSYGCVILSLVLSISVFTLCSTSSLYDKVSSQDDCPLWHIVNDSRKCQCGNSLDGVINCDKNFIHIEHGYCMTWNNLTMSVEAQQCLLTHQTFNTTCTSNDDHFNTYKIPINISVGELNHLMCKSFNRKGAHCSQCIDNYGPAAFTDSIYCADCTKHKNLWIAQVFFQWLLSTLMCLVFTLFEIKGTSSPLNIIITYAQIGVIGLTFSGILKNALVCYIGQRTTNAIVTVLGVWNMDFFHAVFPHLCVSPSFKAIDTVLFEYIVALNPLFICVFLYVCIQLYDKGCRLVVLVCFPIATCFGTCSNTWNPKRNILNTFATFFLLSYTKMLFTSIRLIAGVYSYNSIGNTVPDSGRLLFDPSVRYFKLEHAPYIAVALFVLLTLIFIPPLFLLLYPTRIFRRLLSYTGFQRWDFLNQTIDIFQGWFKDGTEGTRDFRSISALYLLLRVVIGFEFIVVIVRDYRDNHLLKEAILFSLIHFFLGSLFLIIKPYKKAWMNHVDGIIFLLVGAISLIEMSQDQKSVYILGGIVIIIVMSFIVAYFAYVKCKLFCMH